jgi:hypothetical protein
LAISSSTRKAGPFLGNDATTVFPFAFKVFTSADLRVVNTSALGIESDLVLDTDYTVTLNSDQDSDPGGSVTRATALPTGQRLTITSDVEALQPLVLTNNGGFYPRVINDAFDKITIIAQQLVEQVGRSLKLPISSTASATLPDPAANRLLAWNSNATGFVNVSPTDLVTVAGYADARVETFNGNGSTTAFTIAFNPGVLANLDISISGVTQVAGVDFTWTATTITFTTAPPSGTVVQVRYARPLTPLPNFDNILTAAEDAEAAQTAAEAARDLAEADRVATAADRVQTGLDRVATAADVVLADADRVAAEAASTLVTGNLVNLLPFVAGVTTTGTARERVKRLQMANVVSTSTYFLRNIGYTATPEAYITISQDMSGVATVLSLGTGTGGVGTYIVSPGTVCASTTLTIGGAVVTGAIAFSAGVSTLTVSAVTSGTIAVAATITGSSIYKDVAGLNTNGTNLNVSGLTGVNNFALFPINTSGIVGTVAIDLGSGAAWSLPSNNLSSAGQFDPNKTIVATTAFVSEYDTRMATALAAARAEGQTVFLTSATDTYARRLVKELYIEGGEGDSYILNYETQTLSGPLYRIQFFLRSVALGANVASWSKQNADLPTLIASLPESVKLAQVVNGANQTGYAGVEATLFPTWSALEMTKALTAYTTTAATGVDPACIVSNGQMDDFLVAPRPKGVIYVGPSETYTTVADAVASLRNGVTPFSRSSYPNSDICTYSNQKLIQTSATHNETIVSFTVSGNANGLLLPHYSTLHLPEGAKLSMNGADTAPVLEANHSCRIQGGGEIEQLGNGYGIHIDGVNGLSVAGAAKFLRYRDRHVIENITIRHSGTTSTAAMIGMGISDGQTLICRGVRFIRVGTGTAPLVIAHTSPGCVVPGTIIFENCYFNDALISGSKGLELLKSHSQTVQHKLIVNGTQIDEISASNSVGGASAWVRQGWFDARITYSAILDPA